MISSSGQLLCYSDTPDCPWGAHVFCAAQSDYYRLSSIPAAGLNLRWMRNNVFCDETEYQKMDALCSGALPCQIIFMPYLQGTGSPHLDVRASACFFGLREHHGRGDLIRAVMEGVAFSMREAAERLLKTNSLLISGGGGSSAVWRQIFADVFRCPAYYNIIGDSSSYGAARLALAMMSVELSAGQNKKEVTSPRSENKDVYQNQYERYLKIYPLIKDIY
jgi:xylulokinase